MAMLTIDALEALREEGHKVEKRNSPGCGEWYLCEDETKICVILPAPMDDEYSLVVIHFKLYPDEPHFCETKWALKFFMRKAGTEPYVKTICKD